LMEIDLPDLGYNDNISIDECLSKLNGLVGLKSVKEEVNNLIKLTQAQKLWKKSGMDVSPVALHMVFTGNPGTGKTTVARLIGEILFSLGLLEKGHLVETDRAGLVAGYVGQTAIKTKEIINRAVDGVLFIDEAYSLFSGSEQDFGREAVDTLLKEMEDKRDRLVIILAGYKEEMGKFIGMNPGLQSRFTRYINFEDYDVGELMEIFKNQCKSAGLVLDDSAKQTLIVKINKLYSEKLNNFGNARSIRTYFEMMLSRMAKRIVDDKNSDPSRIHACDLDLVR